MRKRCNKWKVCPSEYCKHHHHHQFKSDCNDECDRFDGVKCVDAKEHESRGVGNTLTYNISIERQR